MTISQFQESFSVQKFYFDFLNLQYWRKVFYSERQNSIYQLTLHSYQLVLFLIGINDTSIFVMRRMFFHSLLLIDLKNYSPLLLTLQQQNCRYDI